MRTLIDFGSGSGGGAPAFTVFRDLDTLAVIAGPAIAEIAGSDGQYYFDFDWLSVATSVRTISWRARLEVNGPEQFGLLDRPMSYGSVLAPAAGAKNLDQLRRETRDAVLEKSSDRGLLPDDTSLDIYVNAANRSVFNQAVKWNPRPWMERSADLAYANPLPFSGIAGAAPIKRIHLVRVKTGGGYAPVTPVEEGELDFADIEEGVTAASITSRWFVEGEALWLTPPPASAPQLRVSFVRAIGSMSDPNDHFALGGQMPDHHDVVVWKAAQLVYRKDEMLRTPWDVEVEDGLRALRSELARNQGQRTRRIRRASHFPNTRRR